MATAEIPSADWRAASERVAPFAFPDENVGYGHVRVQAADGRTRWAAADSRTLVVLQTNGGRGTVEALIPPRIIGLAGNLDEGEDTVELSCDGPGTPVIIKTANAFLDIDPPARLFPDVDTMLEDARSRPSVAARVPVEELAGIVTLAALLPRGVSEEESGAPFLWLEVSPGQLSVLVEWEGLGPARYSVTAECDGEARVSVLPTRLQQLCDAARGSHLSVSVPLDEGSPVVFQDEEWTACLMPFTTGVEQFRTGIEQMLARAFGPTATVRDGDGDYPLPLGQARAYLRLAAQPARVQVFAIVLDDIELGDALLREINELNSGVGFVTVFWVAGQVLVESEMVASTLDPEELMTACRAIERVASETAPMLSAMFGGVPTALQRGGGGWLWDRYATSHLTVEIAPGRWVALNGSDGVAVLPFAAPLYIITAWNPRGHDAPAETNAEAQAALVAQLWTTGAYVVRALGGDPDGGHSEESVCAIGIDRETAQALGRSFGQAAIFEVDDAEVRVVACDDSRIVSHSRRPDA